VRLGKGGEVEKFNDNLKAIRTLKAIEAEHRRATPDEQRALARYVGWGGLANAFPVKDTETGKEVLKPEWEKRGQELAELLSDKEYQLARRSTLDSHFTSEDVVSAMWSAARRLGFRGGMTLESSMGPGNFLGLIPDDMAGQTRFIGVEYDSLTARIATLLYPQETVLNAGFQAVPLPDGTFDLNIGNPPFGDQSLRFQYKPELNGATIHNQFIRGALDALKPGGLQIQVVSSSLMDKLANSDRAALAKKGRLLGAIRLPDTAFKENARTEVVTDILFIQRLTAGEERAMAEAFEAANRKPEKSATDEAKRQQLAAGVPAWVKTAKLADPLGGEDMDVNRYFVQNPHMVMGRIERSGTMYRGGSINVKFEKGASLSDALARAIEFLPQDVAGLEPDAIAKALTGHSLMSDALRIALSGQERGSIRIDLDGKLQQVVEKETANGEFLLARRELTAESPWSDQLLQSVDGAWYKLEVKKDAEGKSVKVKDADGKDTRTNLIERTDYPTDADVPALMRLGEARFERLKLLVGLRDLMVEQINLETADAPTARMEGNRAKFKAAYQSFVAKHGLISEPSNARLVDDMPDGALVQALEDKYRAAITPLRAKAMGEQPRPASVEPAPILSRRVIPKYEPATKADSATDALQITLSEFGKIKMDRIAELLSTDENGAISQLAEIDHPLIFKDPETNTWETRAVYLSGQVKRKLVAARAAGLRKNAEALEKVQPEPIGPENVTALLGSTWVPPEIYADFFEHMTGQKPRITFNRTLNRFTVRMPDESTRELNEQWGGERIRVETLIENQLNTEPVRVYDHTDDGPRVNVTLTELAQIKAAQIATEYQNWVFDDGDRRNQLVEVFNDRFNTRANRQHDGSHLVLPGKVPDVILRMRRHQKNAIWRGITERFMLMDHVVGAGKTFTAIARAMERRRMGLSKKPMIVVPNHMVEQFTIDVYRLYPGAKVLSMGKRDLEKKNRRKAFAKIAAGDHDIVIVPHSSFAFIDIAKETEERYLEVELAAAEQAIKDAVAEDPNGNGFRKSPTVKQAERLRDKLIARMDRIKGRTKADRLLTFEQLGVDDLTVDEAHEFKNLFYNSKLADVKGMGNPTGSQKAFDLYNKVRVLRESPTGTVTFMTGTPISNSAVEMYNMMRYLAADQLAELGLEHFDAWRAQFVSTDPGWEADETGRLKEVRRLGRTWSNMRSLMDLYYSFTDSVGNDDIKAAYREDNNGAEFPIPRVKGGDRQSVVIQPTQAQSELLKTIIDDFNSLPGIKDPKERNATRLRLMDRSRKVSLDVRAADRSSDSLEKGGKLERASDETKRIYDQFADRRGTQLIFLDRSVPKASGDKAKLKDYDAIVAQRDAALAKADEEGYRKANDKLEVFDANEMAEMRAAQSGGWNAYQQIKDNLIARGIPANEIRFIQEANNDAQKQALFDAVNDGTVRVLIGSTQRMGAGTNVQKRLVGLHHADVTWKPSDIEQREGRIIRQGNLFATPTIDGLPNPLYDPAFEVQILAYATERTIDAKMWGLNSTKLRTINGIRKYDGAFQMEFEDEESVSMAEMAALASGDPLLMERVKLVSEIRKLEILEDQHRRKAWGVKSQIEQFERNIKDFPATIAKLDATAKRLTEAKLALEERAAARTVTVDGQVFKRGQWSDAVKAAQASAEAQQAGNDKARYAVTIDGKKYTNKEAIANAVSAALGDANAFEAIIDGQNFTTITDAGRKIAEMVKAEAEVLGNGSTVEIELGAFAGYKFGADLSLSSTGGMYRLELNVSDEQGRILSQDSARSRENPDYTTAALTGPLMGLDFKPYIAQVSADNYRQSLETAQRELPLVQARKGAPFTLASELAEKRERLEEVTKLLAGTKSVDIYPDLRDMQAEEWDIANPTGWPNVPDVKFDFQDTEVLPVPEAIEAGPVHSGDAAAMAKLQLAFRSKVPSFKDLTLTALPRVTKPGARDSQLAHDRYAAVDMMEKAYGKRVVFFHSSTQFANGMQADYLPGYIFINENTTRPIMAVLGHELLHSLRVDHPALYAKLSDRVRAMLENPGAYGQLLNARRASRGMAPLTFDKLREELIADIVGDNFTDPRFWRQMSLSQPSLFGRVLRVIRDFLDTLLSKLKNERPYGTDRYLSDVQAARDAVVDAMRQFSNDPKTSAAAVANAAENLTDTNEPFYSELARQVETAKMGSAPAQGWADWLKGLTSKGTIKADEVAWTGLDDWLAMQPGKITRAQVQQFLEGNGVKVTETTLGVREEPILTEPDAIAYLRRETGLDPEEEYGYSTPNDYVDLANQMQAERGGGTKYSQYTLPGGTNYREVLLTLPGEFEVRRAKDGSVVSRHSILQEARAAVTSEAGLTMAGSRAYKSSHWDQPNVLVHIRLNDRTDANGKRVLFVEEIQSDWAQEGKKKGFADQRGAALTPNEHKRAIELQTIDRQRELAPAERTELDDLLHRHGRSAPGLLLPVAPFVGKTDAWISLAIKRVIKMAVDEGYDRVAFINGDQSAERYDLSKQVDSIRVVGRTDARTGEKTRSVTVELNEDGGTSTFGVDANGVVDNVSGTRPMRDAKGKPLSDVIGKEMAERVMTADLGTLRGGVEFRGDGLKVGGEGMKAFYDKIVPSVAKDVLKKLGGDELTQVPLRVGAPAKVTRENKFDDVLYRDTVQQPGFDITDSMREKAAGGLPMFDLKDYTDEQREALARAGIDTRTRLQRAGDRIRLFYDQAARALRGNYARQFQQGYLDQFTGIKEAIKNEIGGLPTDQDPYVAARLANGGASSVMRGLMLHGQARWAANGQHLEKIDGTEGLLDILKPLGEDLNDFFGWMIGNRAARLMAEGRENNFTPEQIKVLQALNKGKEAQFRRAALGYAAFKRSVLDIAEGAGLLDAEGRKVWDQADYIPFYRQIDDKAVFSATGKKGLSGQTSGIRTLKGGTSALNDPMENILMNFSRLVDASLKNSALRKTISVLEDAGSDIIKKVGYDMSRQILPAAQIRDVLERAGTPDQILDIIPPDAFDGMAKMWAIQPPADKDVVRIMVDGKPKFYKVNDPLLLKSLTSFVPFDFPGLGVARAFKRILTGAVTSTPEFMARNFIRDTGATALISRDGFHPFKSLAGIAKSYTEKGAYEAMLFAGASFQSGQVNAADPTGTATAMRRALRQRGFNASSASDFMASIVDTPAKFWEKYRHVGDAIENANREAVYEAAMKAGRGETGAAFESKDLMDFTLRGSSPVYQLMADVLPFFNARVQGLYRVGRADPKRLAMYGTLMMMASLALAFANAGNDDYDKLPDWDKDSYWHFWVKGQHFRIPKPFELGVVFATVPERIMRYAKGLDSGAKTAGRIYANIRDQLAFDPLPQMVRPGVNVWANKDTFRDAPIEGMSDEGKLPSQRYSKSTSATAVAVVKGMGSAADEIGLSPKKLEYLVGGYLGTAGLYALGLSDMAVRALNNEAPAPAKRLDQLPLIGSFYRQDPGLSTVYESDLYKMRTELDQVFASIHALRKDDREEEADALESKNEKLLGARRAINLGAKNLAGLHKQRDEIYADRAMTPKEKRDALDDIAREQGNVAKETMKNEDVLNAR
jgi:N12 class adenine-specific DNA methylase